MRATTQSLSRRVALLEANARAAQPLLVWLRCFSGEVVRVKGPDGAEWHRKPDETAEDLQRRAIADTRLAMRDRANPPALWPMLESNTATDRPFSKKDLTT